MPRARNLSFDEKRAKKNEINRKSYWRKKYGTDPPAPGTISTRQRQSVKPLMTRTPLSVALGQTSACRHSPSRFPSPQSTRSPQSHSANFNIPPPTAPPESDAMERTPPTPPSVPTSSLIQPPELDPLTGTAPPTVDPFYGVDFEQLRLFYDTNFSANSACSNNEQQRGPDAHNEFAVATPSADAQQQAWDRDIDNTVTGNSVPPTQVPTECPLITTSVDVPDDAQRTSSGSLPMSNDASGTATLSVLWGVLEKMKKKNQELASRSGV